MSSIICGVEGSAPARGAARVARGLSRKLGLDLVVVRVLEDGAPGDRVDATAERLEHLGDSASEVDSDAVWLVESGDPSDRLVAAASESEANLIVVHSRGPRSSPLGGISAEAARRGTYTVIVVPPGANAELNSHDPQDGTANFGVGPDVTDSAGDIARFGLG